MLILKPYFFVIALMIAKEYLYLADIMYKYIEKHGSYIFRLLYNCHTYRSPERTMLVNSRGISCLRTLPNTPVSSYSGRYLEVIAIVAALKLREQLSSAVALTVFSILSSKSR